MHTETGRSSSDDSRRTVRPASPPTGNISKLHCFRCRLACELEVRNGEAVCPLGLARWSNIGQQSSACATREPTLLGRVVAGILRLVKATSR